jgi:hypothetical protein
MFARRTESNVVMVISARNERQTVGDPEPGTSTTG